MRIIGWYCVKFNGPGHMVAERYGTYTYTGHHVCSSTPGLNCPLSPPKCLSNTLPPVSSNKSSEFLRPRDLGRGNDSRLPRPRRKSKGHAVTERANALA